MKSVALIALCVACGCSSAARADKLDSTLSIGTSSRIWSQVLNEERRVLIYLPPNYAVSGHPYPVLYLLDAEAQFHQATGIVQFLASYNGRIPEMIVVGVTNTDRGRDLTTPVLDPEEKKKIPAEDYGGAEQFLKFMGEELVPWVNSHYRTVSYRILVGHSFGGLFSSYAFVTRPELFAAHIQVSPSLWWDKQGAMRRAEAGIRQLKNPPWLFVSWGDNEKVISDSAGKLVANLTENPVPGLTLEHRYYKGDDHLSTPHRTLYDALELLFSGWRMTLYDNETPVDLTLDAVQSHYAALSQRYGFDVPPTAAALNAAGQTLLRRKENEQGLAVLRRNVTYYPYLADTHMQLGEALQKLGRKEEALLAYQKAIEAAVNDETPYGDPIAQYRRKVRELAGK